MGDQWWNVHDVKFFPSLWGILIINLRETLLFSDKSEVSRILVIQLRKLLLLSASLARLKYLKIFGLVLFSVTYSSSSFFRLSFHFTQIPAAYRRPCFHDVQHGASFPPFHSIPSRKIHAAYRRPSIRDTKSHSQHVHHGPFLPSNCSSPLLSIPATFHTPLKIRAASRRPSFCYSKSPPQNCEPHIDDLSITDFGTLVLLPRSLRSHLHLSHHILDVLLNCSLLFLTPPQNSR